MPEPRIRATCHACGAWMDPGEIAAHRERCGQRGFALAMVSVDERGGVVFYDVTPRDYAPAADATYTVVPARTITTITTRHPDGRVTTERTERNG